MKINIIESIDDFLIISLNGRMDASGLDEIDEQFLACISDASKNVIVDMCEVEYMASFGIRFFLSTAKYLIKHQKKLVIASPQHTVLGVLKLAGIDSIIMISNTIVDAKKFLGH